MTSRNMILVTDTCLDEHTVAAVCNCNTTTADATLIAQQAARTSKLSSCVAKIVEMLVSGSVKKTNSTTSLQHLETLSTCCGLVGDLLYNISITNPTSGVRTYTVQFTTFLLSPSAPRKGVSPPIKYDVPYTPRSLFLQGAVA